MRTNLQLSSCGSWPKKEKQKHAGAPPWLTKRAWGSVPAETWGSCCCRDAGETEISLSQWRAPAQARATYVSRARSVCCAAPCVVFLPADIKTRGRAGVRACACGLSSRAVQVCSVCAEIKQAVFFSKKQWAERAHKRKCLVCTNVTANAKFPDLAETKAAIGLGLTPAELEAMCKYTGATELHPSDIDLTDGRFQRGDALRAMGFNAQVPRARARAGAKGLHRSSRVLWS